MRHDPGGGRKVTGNGQVPARVLQYRATPTEGDDRMDRGPDLVAAALAEALSRNQCVSAWLGPGNVLFLGLGTAIIAERDPDGRRSTPPYELQTNFADWTIECPGGPTIPAADPDRSEEAAPALTRR